jgi:predicted RecA/RadA family phage recombinase
MVEFVQDGAAVDYTPNANISAGTVIVQGELVGVAKRDIKANILGALAVEGVFDFNKESATVFAAGALAYWDAANSRAVTTASGNKLIGKAIRAAAAGTLFVRVRMSQ